MSDISDLELAVKVRVEGQQALESTANSTRALGAAAKSESSSIDGLAGESRQLNAAVTQLNASLAGTSTHLGSVGGATKHAASEMAEARHAIRGLGEEIGVSMPRFVSSFIASLGPVGPALAKAFSVVAIIGILEMLPELYNKFEEFVDKLGGLTERMRKQNVALVEQSNKAQIEALGNAEKLRDLNTVGVEGSAKVALQLQNMSASAREYGQALRQAMKTLEDARAHEAEFYKFSISADKKRAEEEVDRAQAQVDRLTEETRRRAVNSPERRQLAASIAVQVADERRATQEAAASAGKSLQLAQLDEYKKTIEQMRSLRMITEDQETDELKKQADARAKIENDYAKQVYQIKSQRPGANRALLAEELKDEQDAAKQKADATKRELDLGQQIRDRDRALSAQSAKQATEREVEDIQVGAQKAAAARQSAYTTHMLQTTSKPGREVDTIQQTYNAAISLSDELQAREQVRIDQEQEWADKQTEVLKYIEAQGKVQLDREKLIADVQARRDEARITAEEKIADLQKKRIDEAKSEAERLYDAIRGGPGGVQKFVLDTTRNLEKGMFVNLLSNGPGGGVMGSALNSMSSAIPGQRNADGTNSFLGSLLQGTMFGQRTPTSILKVQPPVPVVDSSVKFDADSTTLTPDIAARKDNTKAIGDLTSAVNALDAVLTGRQASLINGGVTPLNYTPASDAASPAAVAATNATGAAAATASAAAASASSSQTQAVNSIGAMMSLLTLGGSIAAAVTQNQSPGIRVVQGPGQGRSGQQAYPYGSSIWADIPLADKVAIGGLAATAGFGALSKTGVLSQLQGSSSSVMSALGNFGAGFALGPTQGLGTINSSTGQITGGVIGAWTDPNISTSQAIGQTAGLAAGVTGGVMSAIKGFSQGGGRGITSGIASVAGTAAMLDPEPISKGILTAVAAVGGIVKDLFGDPKAERQRDITNTLAQNQFIAPPTVNGVQSLGGNDLAYNKYGKFMATPYGGYTVTDATEYQNQVTGDYFKTPGSVAPGDYIGMPGQQVTPSMVPTYQAASSGGQTVVNMTVHAMDSQSIVDRSHDIGMAIYKELNAGGALGLRIQQTVFGA